MKKKWAPKSPLFASRPSKKHPFPSAVLANYNLNGPGSKQTNHVALSLQGSGLVYEVGDALGVFPQNPAGVVDEIIAALPFKAGDVPTPTGFRITPVLAIVRRGFTITPNPVEVDAVFEVPLSFLMNPENHALESRVWDRIERHYYVMPYQDRKIWGITAGIVRTLYERFYA